MRIVLEAVAYEEEGFWIAHVVDRSFVSYAERLEDLANALLDQATAQVEVEMEAGQEPFFGFKPARQRYHDMLEAAKRECVEPLVPKKDLKQLFRELRNWAWMEIRVYPVSSNRRS